MKINGSPTTKALFGCDSQEDNLLDDVLSPEPVTPVNPSKPSDPYTTPSSSKRKSMIVTPSNSAYRRSAVTPMSAARSKKVKGIYGSQEGRSPLLQGEVWESMRRLNEEHPELEQFSLESAIRGTCLYRGKAAHLTVIIKTVECVSNQDTSLIVCDETGEMRAAVHPAVKAKYGALLESGAGLLLRQCSIFSFVSVQRYLNLTLANLLYIFNSSSTAPSTSTLTSHLKEVEETLQLRKEHPEFCGSLTPLLSTPNRPAPGRGLPPSRPTPSKSTSSRSTPSRPTSSTSTGYNKRTPSTSAPGSSRPTPTLSGSSRPTTALPGSRPAPAALPGSRPAPPSAPVTPVRGKRPVDSVPTTPQMETPKRQCPRVEPSRGGSEGSRDTPDVSRAPVNKQPYVLSEKDKAEIAKILDEVDDDDLFD